MNIEIDSCLSDKDRFHEFTFTTDSGDRGFDIVNVIVPFFLKRPDEARLLVWMRRGGNGIRVDGSVRVYDRDGNCREASVGGIMTEGDWQDGEFIDNGAVEAVMANSMNFSFECPSDSEIVFQIILPPSNPTA